MKRKLVILAIVGAVVLASMFGGYSTWNNMSPDNSCYSCHEISSRVDSFHVSAHRDLRCADCHGTATSDGVPGFMEKANMVFQHFTRYPVPEEICMNENQVLRVSGRCMECHQSEAANWMVGGHATTYEDIFMDPVHNAMEAPYADCFRCHGMYFDGTIDDLMTPLDQNGPWQFKDAEIAHNAAVPCLACHQAHTPNPTLAEYALAGTNALPRNEKFSLYSRADKMHLQVDKLAKPKMFHEGKEIMTSDSPTQALCIRCHSPNVSHQAGTDDGRTPVGVHEGLSCNACHEPHSNNAMNSCVNCHPGSSNCGIDVRTMDTTFANLESPNNIHSVSCFDCHVNDERLNHRL
jgi:hypothetical protein